MLRKVGIFASENSWKDCIGSLFPNLAAKDLDKSVGLVSGVGADHVLSVVEHSAGWDTATCKRGVCWTRLPKKFAFVGCLLNEVEWRTMKASETPKARELQDFHIWISLLQKGSKGRLKELIADPGAWLKCCFYAHQAHIHPFTGLLIPVRLLCRSSCVKHVCP